MSKEKAKATEKDILNLLDKGLNTADIEAELSVSRDLIGRTKSKWLVQLKKDRATRKKNYLEANAHAFKQAKKKAKQKKDKK